MSRFVPCSGHDFCTKEGSHCQGCGRSHEEIAKTRELVEQCTQFALSMGYENVEEFAAYLAGKVVSKVRWTLAEQKDT